MEIFVEQLVAKKRTTGTKVLKVLIIIGAAFIALILAHLSLVLGIWSFITILGTAAAIYGAYRLVKSFNIEYEYILTNADLDIDKIVARSRRKRLASFNLKNLEMMAPVSEKYQRELNNINIKNRLDASTGEAEGACFLKIMHPQKGLSLLIFNPDERIVQGIKSVAPRKVLDL